MPGKNDITTDWLKSALSGCGYDVTVTDGDSDGLLAKHDSRPNLIIKVRSDLGLITFSHVWGMKKPGWGGDKTVLDALNKANSMSWYSVFFRDNDGDLGVTSYIALTECIEQADVSVFLEREASKFTEVLVLSGLHDWVQ